MGSTSSPHLLRYALALAMALLALLATLVLAPRDEEFGDVDAVVVLGGGTGERVALGRELAGSRDVPLVLFAEAIGTGTGAGLSCGAEVVCLAPDPWTTAGEARTTAQVAASRGWQRIGVVTSRFHVNRARTLFEQCLAADAVDVTGAGSDTGVMGRVYRYGRELVAHTAAVTVARAC